MKACFKPIALLHLASLFQIEKHQPPPTQLTETPVLNCLSIDQIDPACILQKQLIWFTSTAQLAIIEFTYAIKVKGHFWTS